jgi:hypothetical protein
VLRLFDLIIDRGGLNVINDRRYGVMTQAMISRSNLWSLLMNHDEYRAVIDYDVPDPKTGRTMLIIMIDQPEWACNASWFIEQFPKFDIEACDHEGRNVLDYINLYPIQNLTLELANQTEKRIKENKLLKHQATLRAMVKHLSTFILPKYKSGVQSIIHSILFFIPKELTHLIFKYTFY